MVPVELARGPNTTRIEVQVVPAGSGRRNSTRPVVPVAGGIVQRSTIHVPRPGEIQRVAMNTGRDKSVEATRDIVDIGGAG